MFKPIGGNVPHLGGDSTTYVRDQSRDAELGDSHRCSSVPGSGTMDVPGHNNQVGHKREPRTFCCVTTRRILIGVLLRTRCAVAMAWSGGDACSTPLGTPLTLGCRMGLAYFRLLTALLLSLGRLPAAHQLPALRILTVSLVPPASLIDVAAAFTQARPPAKTSAAGRTGATETRL